MSVREPKGASWDTPATELARISDRAATMKRNGDLNALAFEKLWQEALTASKGHSELLQTLEMYRPKGAKK